MRTRGKRVTAECVIRRDVLLEVMRVEPESLHYHWGVANIGAILSGANNNGSIRPMRSRRCSSRPDRTSPTSRRVRRHRLHELTAEKDLYLSITIPSLIVATHGGGTHLPTQRECLGCSAASARQGEQVRRDRGRRGAGGRDFAGSRDLVAGMGLVARGVWPQSLTRRTRTCSAPTASRSCG